MIWFFFTQVSYLCSPLHSFFVVEDTVLHTTQSLTVTGSKVGEGLVTRGIVHEFWGMAQDEVLAVLRNTCVSSGSLEEYWGSCFMLIIG